MMVEMCQMVVRWCMMVEACQMVYDGVGWLYREELSDGEDGTDGVRWSRGVIRCRMLILDNVVIILACDSKIYSSFCSVYSFKSSHN